MTLDVPNLKDFDARLREEAQQEPNLEVPGTPTKKTQIIAIYGKVESTKLHAGQSQPYHGRTGQTCSPDWM